MRPSSLTFISYVCTIINQEMKEQSASDAVLQQIHAMSTVLVCPCARLIHNYMYTGTRCKQVRIKTVHSSIIKAPIKHTMVKDMSCKSSGATELNVTVTCPQHHIKINMDQTIYGLFRPLEEYCGRPVLRFLFGSHVKIFFGMCLPFVACDISTVIWSS